MAIPEEFISNLRSNCDITDTMSPYVTLKRAGRDYVCLCPFHSEKTPSCHVYTESQSFYCFGCGAGGDSITFIRRIENLDYIESLKFLADKLGMILPENGENDKSAILKIRILEMNREAARFFRDYLLSANGQVGLDYLYGRGLSPNTIKKYGLGYAPNDWHELKMHMRKKGYNDDELVQASLLVQNNNKIYDKFRNRIMFPIIDRRGNVIAFGGRILDPDGMPKYLNSSETMVFKKRNNLYSLNFAKNAKERYFILCEGNLDVITLNQAGFDNTVATLGTAITEEQTRLIRQYADEVVLAYDADTAGQNATVKAMNLFHNAGLSVRVLNLSGAKDPDEYIKIYGKESFRELIKHSGSALSFELKRLRNDLDTDTSEGRTEYLKRTIKLLSEINSKPERTIYISEVAKICEITSQAVELNVEEEIKKRRYYKQTDETKKIIRGEIKGKDTIPLFPDEIENPIEARAERGIIAFLFHSPDKLSAILLKITPDYFLSEFNRNLFELLIQKLTKSANADISLLGSEFSITEAGRIEGIRREGFSLPFTLERLEDYINILKKHKKLKGRKSPADMTDDELREYGERLYSEKQRRNKING